MANRWFKPRDKRSFANLMHGFLTEDFQVVDLSKRTLAKEHNRRVILDAARGVFGLYGYRSSTVRDIIGATSLASGTFYNYFRSKEDVFAALRDELAHEVRPLLRAEREQAQSADDFVTGTFRAFLSHMAARSSSLAAINACEEQASFHARMVIMGSDDLRRDIEMATSRGLFANVNAELLAAAMVGVAFEVAEVLRQKQHADVNEAARFCSELVLRGVASSPAAAKRIGVV